MNTYITIANAVDLVPEVREYLSAATLLLLARHERMSLLAVKHVGPGPHPGTGTSQEVHAGGTGPRTVSDFSFADGAISALRRLTIATGREGGVLFDRDGNLIAKYGGSATRTDVDVMSLPEGSVLLHSHPDMNLSFSPDDLVLMQKDKTSMWIVVASHSTYVAEKTGIQGKVYSLASARRACLAWMGEVERPAGMSWQTHDALSSNVAAQKLAESMGFRYYERRDR